MTLASPGLQHPPPDRPPPAEVTPRWGAGGQVGGGGKAFTWEEDSQKVTFAEEESALACIQGLEGRPSWIISSFQDALERLESDARTHAHARELNTFVTEK